MHTVTPVKVIVYEDVDFLRSALVELINLTPGLQCVAGLDSCTDIISDVALFEPDILLMDIDMPGLSGIDGVRILKTQYPNIPVMMHTIFDNDKKVFDAICAGASGYLLKKSTPAELVEAIFSLAKGGAPMTPSIASKVLQMFRDTNFQKGITKEEYNLTEKEREVLSLLVKGNSYKMIAADLNLSIDGIKFHIKNIYKKLHVNSQTEAVAKSLQERIV
jgi:DNA-binding NarL/FixJ family response regulator